MGDQNCLLAVLALAVGALGGCAATDDAAAPHATGGRAVHGGLILPSPLMLDLEAVTGRPAAIAGADGVFAAPDVLSRNDPPAASGGGTPDFTRFQGVDYWNRERLRITNGRPREQSTFEARSWRHRGAW